MIATRNSSPPGARPLPSWERLGAAVIDFLVLAVLELIAAVPIAGKQYAKIISFEEAHGGRTANLAKNPHFVSLANKFSVQLMHLGIVAAALTAIYLIGMYLGAGATLGKLALGLRVTRVDGRPMTIRDAVFRSIVFWVANPFLIPVIGVLLWLLQFIGGTLVLLIRPDHRGPEDLLGGTMVVRKADRGRTLADIAGYDLPSVPPAQPPDAPTVRSGHLPGWGPVGDQPPPPAGSGPEEAPK
ncbi:MAG: RDD family protein [Candidatus Dormiibacterota bacterium]